MANNSLSISRPSSTTMGTMAGSAAACKVCSSSATTPGCGSGSGVTNCPAPGIGPRKHREATMEKIRDYVLLMLGAPTIKVELDQQALDMCVEQSLAVFEEWAPRDYFDYYVFQTIPGKSVYQMPPDIGIIRNVFYKEQGTFAFQASDLDGSIPVEYFYPGGAYSSIQGGLIDPIQPIWGRMGEWVLYKQYEQMYSRLSSNLGGWEWVSDHDCVKIYPTPCKCSRVIVHYLQKCKDWKQVRLEMQEGALAHAYIILGTIRGKYPTIPGGLSLDAEYYKTKGWELYDKWKEELITRYGDLPYISLD